MLFYFIIHGNGACKRHLTILMYSEMHGIHTHIHVQGLDVVSLCSMERFLVRFGVSALRLHVGLNRLLQSSEAKWMPRKLSQFYEEGQVFELKSFGKFKSSLVQRLWTISRTILDRNSFEMKLHLNKADNEWISQWMSPCASEKF